VGLRDKIVLYGAGLAFIGGMALLASRSLLTPPDGPSEAELAAIVRGLDIGHGPVWPNASVKPGGCERLWLKEGIMCSFELDPGDDLPRSSEHWRFVKIEGEWDAVSYRVPAP
jgi:hypothetical protein